MDLQLPQVLAAFLASAGVVIFAFGAARLLEWRALDRRIRDYVSAELGGVRPIRRLRERDWRLENDLSRTLNRRLRRTTIGTVLQERLVRAGVALRPPELMLIMTAGACAGVVFGLWLMRPAIPSVRLAGAIALGIAGFLAPILTLDRLARRRMSDFERQLPQAIDSMAGVLEAGSSLPQAMEVIAREMNAPISVEFRRVLRESELGLSFTDALGNLVTRLPSSDMLLLTSAVSIQNRVGGDLAAVFRGIAETIRERLRLRAEVRVFTAQGRYSTYVITLLPVGLFWFLWVTNYDYISQLFLPGITRALFFAGIAGVALGYYAMNRIATIDVDLAMYLPALLAAGAVFCFVLAARDNLARARVVQRLDIFVAPAIGGESTYEGPSFRTRAVVPLVAWLARITGRLMPAGQRERTRTNLLLAGMPYTWQWTNFLAAKTALGAAVAGLTLLYAIRSDTGLLLTLLLAAFGAAAGFYLPGVWLGRRIRQRQTQILRALPDALDLLSISVSAGLGLEAAMLEVVQRWKNALTEEFNAVLRDLKLGTSRADALRDFARRTGLDEVQEFSVSVIQADELGMPLKDVLQTQADQIRLRRRHRAEEQARKATIKMLVPMVFLVFPALVIVLLGPAIPALRLITTVGAR